MNSVAGDGIFAERERLHRNHMLRPFGIEAPIFGQRAAHREAARGNADHLRTIGAFLKFAIVAPCAYAGARRKPRKQECTKIIFRTMTALFFATLLRLNASSQYRNIS